MYYYTPTKLYIDTNEYEVGKIISEYGFSKVLVLCGKSSAFKSGLIDIVCQSLEDNGLTYYLESGVSANPNVAFVRSVLAKEYDFDFILAVGGGSVMDTAKSIAVSQVAKCDPFEFNSGKRKPTDSIKVGVILTIAASGSEMSDSCVLTDEETNTKAGFNSDLNRPLFAITNPQLTYSVSHYQTACGAVDIMMHTLERFLSDDKSLLADNFAIALLKTVYDITKDGYIVFNDYQARKQLLLASSFSHNGLTGVGKKYYFRVHKFEHVLSGFYPNIAHGAGLSICFLAYAKYVYKKPYFLDKFDQLGKELFGSKSHSKEVNALNAILQFEDYFKRLGMPITMDEFGVSKAEATRFALKVTNDKNNVVKDIFDLDYEDCLAIYQRMWK